MQNDVPLSERDFDATDLVKFEEWIALAVEDIISHSSHAATLMVGNCETFLDCVILACWRRVQQWSVVNMLAEFRMYTWPHKLHDYEQFIERFNTLLVDVVSLSPEFYVIHSNLKVSAKYSVLSDVLFIKICMTFICYTRKKNIN